MSHIKLAGDVFMLMKLHRFLESKHVLWSSNVIFNDSWRATFGTWIPAQDAQSVFVQLARRLQLCQTDTGTVEPCDVSQRANRKKERQCL